MTIDFYCTVALLFKQNYSENNSFDISQTISKMIIYSPVCINMLFQIYFLILLNKMFHHIFACVYAQFCEVNTSLCLQFMI